MGIGKRKLEMGKRNLRTLSKLVNGEWDYQTNEGDGEDGMCDV